VASGLTVLDDKVYTIEDYMRLDDDNRYELIGGKLIMVPRPQWKHQKISGALHAQFLNFLNQNPIGEVLWDLDVHLGDKVVRPDVLFIPKKHIEILGESFPNAAPDLVIEVLSPSSESHDRKTKSKLYFENGVKEYWVVDPQQKTVEVFTAGEKNWTWIGVFDQEDVLTTSLLPGLEIRLEDVFT
jgi:Uma2 family endonuclease